MGTSEGTDDATTADAVTGELRRWLALGFTLLAVSIAVLDNTVLVVSIPRIIADLDTDVASAQWVFTGYALVFASILVIGGRLGDIHGPRRLVLIGTGVFGVGSLIAALSTSLPMLIVGEAIIEGIGAGLLVPNTVALLARTFGGRQRIAAFAAYATVLGAAASIGPVLGGYLTTYHSWRWCFGINVIIAPVVIVGLLSTTERSLGVGNRERLDVRGAVLIASGTFLLVFGLSQGEAYGYWTATAPVSVGSTDVWPTSMPISIVPVAFLVGVGLIVAFCRTEISLERRDRNPLFEFSQFRHRTFRLANLATFAAAFAQLGVSISIALYLQESRDLTPLQNGLWVLPTGVAILLGGPIGGWASRRWGARATMRTGAPANIVGLVLLTVALANDASYWWVLPSFLVYGIGSGLVFSQMTRVMLNDIAPERSGVATGINTTARQIATALGVATIGTIFATVAADRGVNEALWPAMGTAGVALVAAALVIWRIPPIDHEDDADESLEEAEADSMSAVATGLEH